MYCTQGLGALLKLQQLIPNEASDPFASQRLLKAGGEEISTLPSDSSHSPIERITVNSLSQKGHDRRIARCVSEA